MNDSPRICHLVLLGLIVAGPAFSQAAAAQEAARVDYRRPRDYVCLRALGPLRIDGRLDEPSWQAAPRTESFLDIRGPHEPRPRYATHARMLWDDTCFYIAAHLEEPHVWGTLREHDSVIFHDNDFEVFLDPDGDLHAYGELELNALNTTWDLFLPKPYTAGGRADNSWEIEGMRTAVHVEGSLNDPSDRDAFWSVEIALPWRALERIAGARSLPPADGDTWRVNFSRVQWQHDVVDGGYQKKPGLAEDNWVWSPQGVINMHRPEHWGYVLFSAATVGSGEARDVTVPKDHAGNTRFQLARIYHAQRTFREREGHYADSLEQLSLPHLEDPSWVALKLEATETGYSVSAQLRRESGELETWRLQEDGRIWVP